ncbi:hypothetical protein T4B_3007, partial [Trichinella pseudospiralis]
MERMKAYAAVKFTTGCLNNVERIVGDTHLRVPCSIEHSLTRAELSTFTQCIDVPKLKARQQFRAI